MASIQVARRIDAPQDVVFGAIADARHFARTMPDVVALEYVTPTHSGIGTRFRHIREVNEHEHVTEFEVTEFVENQRLRLVNETRGIVWDSTYTIAPSDAASANATTLTMRLDTRARPIVGKLMMPFVFLFKRKAFEANIDALKAYCERAAR